MMRISSNIAKGGRIPLSPHFRNGGSAVSSPMAKGWRFTFRFRILFAQGLVAETVLSPISAQLSQDRRNQEAASDYYRRWLEETVDYIISQEEREVFQRLKTDEERDAFIEQFWMRRDPDPSTPFNEFKEEHYRRLRFANEQFTAGKPGWRTDRGRIYIKFGPPDHKEFHPGGQYARKSWEGGGVTSVHPFEKWWYRYIEGVGSDVELEFVDSGLSGDYTLALDADEKDAFLRTPLGPTLQELDGLMSRGDRISRRYVGNAANPDNQQERDWFRYKRLQDNIWYRVDQLLRLERPPALRNPRLREYVQAKVTFPQNLPIHCFEAHYPLDSNNYLVFLALRVAERELFQGAGEGTTTSLDLYLRVTGLDGRTYWESDETLHAYHTLPESADYIYYQRTLRLPASRYKVEALVRQDDTRMGIATIPVAIPRPPAGSDSLELSSVILANYLARLVAAPPEILPFVIGRIKVIPAFEHVYEPNSRIGVYFQVFGLRVDSSTRVPAVAIRYEIHRSDGKLIREYEDDGGRSCSLEGSNRMIVARNLPLMGLTPGDYSLSIHVEDRIAGIAKIARLNLRVRDEVRKSQERSLPSGSGR
ncbi:MAG: GWxTD domain-containing protein [Acidobacteria bacterium]|nr:GWxTD domain-containing protein [Acidobacteriota bacterium]